MKLRPEFYPLKSLKSNHKYGLFLENPQSSGKFGRIFIPHSNSHLSPIHEGYKGGGGAGVGGVKPQLNSKISSSAQPSHPNSPRLAQHGVFAAQEFVRRWDRSTNASLAR